MSDDGNTRERGRIVDLDDRTIHVRPPEAVETRAEDPFDGAGSAPRSREGPPPLRTPPLYSDGLAILILGAILVMAPPLLGTVLPDMQARGIGILVVSTLFLGGMLLVSRGLLLLKRAADHA